MRTHFIAIGGAAMHNLALALHAKKYQVTGSDDAIFEPSKSRLEKKGLLPIEMGWFPEKITPDIEAIILGMHAKADNPELLKAQEMGLKIYSYPEFLYEQSKNKSELKLFTFRFVKLLLLHLNTETLTNASMPVRSEILA